jgi:hypothetical protein
MALGIDGFAVLRSIGTHPDAFPGMAGEIDKAAHALVVKRMKSKGLDLTDLRAVQRALGDRDFSQVLGAMKDSEIKSLLAKIDKYCAESKTAGADWRLDRLRSLASGSAEPFPMPEKKPTKSKRTAAAKKVRDEPSAPTRLHSEAMAAVRRKK